MWILILIMYSGQGVSDIEMQEFTSLERCEAAAEYIAGTERPSPRKKSLLGAVGHDFPTIPEYKCVEK